jgi:hypothetical protein
MIIAHSKIDGSGYGVAFSRARTVCCRLLCCSS